jgi:glycerophosphoryl diester phosphodiesterase
LTEIRELDAGTHFDTAFAGEHVPTLDDVLTTFGDQLLINIELKPQPRQVRQLAERVMAVVRRLDLERRVWVSSFQPYALHAARQAAPQVPCGLLYSPLSLLTPLFLPITPAEALHPHVSLVRPWFVRLAHCWGKRVIVWTVDDPLVARGLADAQVDAIITNNPAAVREVVRQGRP